MDRGGNFLPTLNLLPGVDVWDAWVSCGLRCDDGGIGDEEGSWDLGALGVVLGDHWQWDVVLVAAETGEWRQSDAVLELGAANLDRLEELGLSGGDHLDWLVWCLRGSFRVVKVVFICSGGVKEYREGGMDRKKIYTADQPHLIVSLPFFTAA